MQLGPLPGGHWQGWVWAGLKNGNMNLRIEAYQCWVVPVTMISLFAVKLRQQ